MLVGWLCFMAYQSCLYIYIYIYIICKRKICNNIFKRAGTHLFAHSWIFSNIANTYRSICTPLFGFKLCQEKKVEVYSPAMRITLIHQYKDSKTTSKKTKERLITVVSNSSRNKRTNRTNINQIKPKNKQRNRNWEKNNDYFKRQTGEISHEKTWT